MGSSLLSNLHVVFPADHPAIPPSRHPPNHHAHPDSLSLICFPLHPSTVSRLPSSVSRSYLLTSGPSFHCPAFTLSPISCLLHHAQRVQVQVDVLPRLSYPLRLNPPTHQSVQWVLVKLEASPSLTLPTLQTGDQHCFGQRNKRMRTKMPTTHGQPREVRMDKVRAASSAERD